MLDHHTLELRSMLLRWSLDCRDKLAKAIGKVFVTHAWKFNRKWNGENKLMSDFALLPRSRGSDK